MPYRDAMCRSEHILYAGRRITADSLGGYWTTATMRIVGKPIIAVGRTAARFTVRDFLHCRANPRRTSRRSCRSMGHSRCGRRGPAIPSEWPRERYEGRAEQSPLLENVHAKFGGKREQWRCSRRARRITGARPKDARLPRDRQLPGRSRNPLRSCRIAGRYIQS